MKLTLETFKKTDNEAAPEELGNASIQIGDKEYLLLQSLESKLKASKEKEVVEEIDADQLHFDPSDDCGILTDCKVQFYLGEEAEAGHFHLVGRRVADNCLVHTNSVMLRMVAL